ncbi:LysR substrate-binding domain-containing protein, partial [Klebsiella pneumoniae]|uniref:LysR substrate-binding domain-containing protein n=1 Tax=Klebsiella pneumoniae TaxID=573 RepID=UPI00397554F2
ILLSSEFATREQIDRYCRLHRLEPDVRMEANSIGAVLSVIRSTTLATLLPAAIAGQFDDVVAIELRPALLQRTACLLQRLGVESLQLQVALSCQRMRTAHHQRKRFRQ